MPKNRKSYSFSVSDSDSGEKIFSLKGRPAGVIAGLTSAIVLIMVLTYLLIDFTPLKKAIRGYPSRESREAALQNRLLVDSLQKRIGFLDDTIRLLGLENVRTCHARAEEFGRVESEREHYDIVCSRAVARLNVLAEYCIPFAKKGGYFIAYKADRVNEEMEEGKKAVRILGGRVDQVISFQLPGTDYNRTLVQVIKEEHTSGKYPRRAGTPGKDPLH